MKTDKTPEKIINYLKMNGPKSASDLAKSFGMTGEGMRLHLVKLEENGMICSESIPKGVGRPTTLYKLTKLGNEKFPDNHASLTVQLLETVQNILGADALQLLIETKKEKDFKRYDEALSGIKSTEEKLKQFTEMRNNEGYLAEYIKDNDGYLFIENHCPICEAASKCGGFCKSEMDNIKSLLGGVKIERIDHTIKGDRRCAYRIIENL